MTTAALFLVLSSALFHATWNLLLKRSGHKAVFFWSFTAVSFIVFLVPAIVFVAIDGLTWTGALFGLGSAAIHGCYGLALSRTYELGDLSSAYPVARGMGVTLIPIAGVAILGEDVSVAAGAGIGLVIAGIYAVQVQPRSLADLLQPARALALPSSRVALLTGGIIATYSLWDKAALDHISPVILNQFNMIGYLIILLPLAMHGQFQRLRAEWQVHGKGIVAAGVLAPLAYVLVLIALTTSQVSYIGPAREVGIVLGAVLGVAFLREGFGASRISGSLLVVAGVLTLGLAP
ncbi:MAG: EamA family transporter [Chloroflexi bacterium]|nr:EamA family transporter [Chloroflexota bacterium]